jgi:hypothetical protein
MLPVHGSPVRFGPMGSYPIPLAIASSQGLVAATTG